MSAALAGFRPRADQYLVELRAPAEQSAGGIYLPDNWVENWTDGVVRVSGPGRRVGGGVEGRAPMWAEPGDIVLFEKHDWQRVEDGSGVVSEDHLIALFPGGDETRIVPLSDWVLIQQDAASPTVGALELPEVYVPKPMSGRVRDWGPGRRVRRGVNEGLRQPVWLGMGLPHGTALAGRRVYWTPECEVMAVGRSALEYVLVRAEDLWAIEEEAVWTVARRR